MLSLRSFGLTAAVLSFVGCSSEPDTSADAAAIRTAVAEWSAAARAENAEAFASFYADDAVLMLEGAPDVSGKTAIRETIEGMMQDPNFALGFTTTNIVVAGSGDLAYETGRYVITSSDANNAPANQSGGYVVVWRKQADGTWKVVIDAPISDPSAPAR
jgi:uncharacterized protein (TIGR02246 family)